MSNGFVPVSPERHGRLRWRRCNDYSFARDLQSVDIALAESGKLCLECPILFRKAGNAYVPIALLGAEANQNAYLTPDFRWVGKYTPAVLRAHPFRMVPTRQGQSELQVELQVDSREVCDTTGEAFFTEDGAPAPALTRVAEFLHRVARGQRLAVAAAARLAHAGAIKPLMIGGKDVEPQAVPGLFTIDETALQALPDATFAALREGGALKFAYHQMLSLERWPLLVDLSHRQRSRREEVAQRTAAICQTAEDGDLQIDWSQFNPPPS